jgi:hypothetical protein
MLAVRVEIEGRVCEVVATGAGPVVVGPQGR